MASLVHAAETGALVTLSEGGIARASTDGPQPIPPFSRVKEGDLLAMDRGSRLKLVFLANGRQEIWEGSGRIEIGANSSKGFGLKEPLVTQLPSVLVAQLAKTPSTETQGRAGMTRLRNIATPEAMQKIETTYRQLRSETEKDDLNPEMYLLSGMFELRALDRVEQAIEDLKAGWPNNSQAKLLVALYQRSLRNIKENQRK